MIDLRKTIARKYRGNLIKETSFFSYTFLNSYLQDKMIFLKFKGFWELLFANILVLLATVIILRVPTISIGFFGDETEGFTRNFSHFFGDDF